LRVKIYVSRFLIDILPGRGPRLGRGAQIRVYLRTSFMPGQGGSKRWSELIGDKGIYNITLYPILSDRVCLFCHKNRSFVTTASIYISSPQRLSVVTNVPGPRIAVRVFQARCFVRVSSSNSFSSIEI